MTVIMFQHRFAPLVVAGTKSQTIRPERRRPIRRGDELSLRRWADKAYRSPQVELRRTVCVSVEPVIVAMLTVSVGGRLLTDAEREAFARADGFDSGMEMGEWFENEHGLPFSGVVIRWSVT